MSATNDSSALTFDVDRDGARIIELGHGRRVFKWYDYQSPSSQQLDALQRADGGWSSADGSAHDVHVTLEAIRALRWEVP